VQAAKDMIAAGAAWIARERGPNEARRILRIVAVNIAQVKGLAYELRNGRRHFGPMRGSVLQLGIELSTQQDDDRRQP
jgi:hypothetical protein